MEGFLIGIDDPRAAEVQELLQDHLTFANEHSPPGDVDALDVTGLLADDVTFFSLRGRGDLLGVGTLRQLDPLHAEMERDGSAS